MERLRTLGLGIGLSIWLVSTPQGLAARSMRSAQGSIVINEVQANPVASGIETDFEWVELFNPGPVGVALGGWRLSDARAMTVLPEITIAPGGYAVVAGARFAERYPDAPGERVTVPRIGNGLGNSGDGLQLADGAGSVIDALSWGDNTSAFDPPAPAAPGGSSLERVPAGRDSNVAADWVVQATPSPGAPATDASPQATATVAGAPGVPADADVRLNEVLAAPHGIDWDGDGTANGEDEWVEVVNVGTNDLNLRGWLLDDIADGGSAAHRILEDTVVPARGHRVFFKRETGLSLNNGGDSARLVQPDGAPADVIDFGASAPDAGWARDPDGTGGWTDRLNPSPGQTNGDTGVRATPVSPTAGASTSVPGPSATANGSATVAPPVGTAVPGGPAVPSPAATATATLYLPFLISEVMFDPETIGNDAAEEWVEIHNRSTAAAGLGGWAIGDRGAWDPLPAVTVAPGGFAIIGGPGAVAQLPPDFTGPRILVGDGRIGGGLGNMGDVVRLRSPTIGVADAVSYGDNLDAFDPSVPLVGAGLTVERLPSGIDSDSATDWRAQPDPSPGRAGNVHDGPPALTLNELLPAPSDVDWDADGTAAHTDEWVELFNASPYRARLAGWRLQDARASSRGWAYRFGGNDAVEPHGFLVVHRAASGIAFDNGGDTVQLVRPDDTVADSFSWSSTPGYDRSWGRTADGAGGWSSALAVTPGQPNRAMEPGERHAGDLARERRAADRRSDRGAHGSSGPRGSARAPAVPIAQPATMAALRAMRRGTRVVVHGRVTAAPNVLAGRTFYLGDESGGVRIYLAPTDRALKPFGVGEPVSAIGRLADYRGERQVVLARPEDAWWDGVGGPVPPSDIATGNVGEAVEGRLVRLHGRQVGYGATSVTLDDGSGPARVVLLRSAGIERQRWARGRWLTIVGVAAQSAARAPWEGGYRVLPRSAADLTAVTNVVALSNDVVLHRPRRSGPSGALRRYPSDAARRAIPRD